MAYGTCSFQPWGGGRGGGDYSYTVYCLRAWNCIFFYPSIEVGIQVMSSYQLISDKIFRQAQKRRGGGGLAQILPEFSPNIPQIFPKLCTLAIFFWGGTVPPTYPHPPPPPPTAHTPICASWNLWRTNFLVSFTRKDRRYHNYSNCFSSRLSNLVLFNIFLLIFAIWIKNTKRLFYSVSHAVQFFEVTHCVFCKDVLFMITKNLIVNIRHK